MLPTDLEALTGEHRDPNFGRWIVAPERIDAISDTVAQEIASAGPLGLDVANLDDYQREALVHLDDVVVEGGRARPVSQPDPLAGHPYVGELRRSPFAPPAPTDVDRGELRELVRRGLVVERDGVWFAADAIDAAARTAAALLREHPDGVTVSQIREALDTSRKYAMPLIAELDAAGGDAASRRPSHRRAAIARLDRLDLALDRLDLALVRGLRVDHGAQRAHPLAVLAEEAGAARRRSRLELAANPSDLDCVGDDLTEPVGIREQP